MASRTTEQVEWSTADSIAVSSGSSSTSDAVSVPSDAVEMAVMAKADNAGTPASGDEVVVELVVTTGDPDVDPDSADEYTTDNHHTFVMQLDTNDDDPAIAWEGGFPCGAKSVKIRATNNSASNSITVSAEIVFTAT